MPPETALQKPRWVNKVHRSEWKRRGVRKCKYRVLRKCKYRVPPKKHEFPEAEKRERLTNIPDGLDDLGLQLWNHVCAEAKLKFEQTDIVSDLDVGPVVYQLRRPLKTHLSLSVSHRWEFSVYQFGPQFIGKGDSIAAARRDFLSQIHSTFQSLVRLRPFQMDETQSADWKMLESLIDVDTYWDSVPVALLETGVVSGVTAEGWEIVWLDGERREFIPVERTLSEFATFKVGQWFESLVERQSKTYMLQKLRYVRSIEPIRKMGEEDFRQWVASLPSGEDVPKSGTDWADL